MEENNAQMDAPGGVSANVENVNVGHDAAGGADDARVENTPRTGEPSTSRHNWNGFSIPLKRKSGDTKGVSKKR